MTKFFSNILSSKGIVKIKFYLLAISNFLPEPKTSYLNINSLYKTKLRDI